MTELRYNSLDNHLKNIDRLKKDDSDNHIGPKAAAVYLIYGDELLCKAAVKKVLNRLLPGSKQRFNFEAIDGNTGGTSEVVEKVKTFSLLSGSKIIGLMDTRIFDSITNSGKILLNAAKAYDRKDMNRAANHLLRFMALKSLSYADLSSENRKKIFSAKSELPEDDRWIDDIISYCREKNRNVPETVDSEILLCRAIEKGFPAGNRLIITTDSVDKRRKLFKLIRNKGIIVDCSVPKGNRKADKIAQEAVMSSTVSAVLNETEKSLAPDAFSALRKITGFELRTLSNNLEKLINYVGDRNLITREDVITVLKRTKRDPIYALTGAFADRKLGETLFFMNALMSEGQGALHPEQILVALLNQVRKLLLVKSFVNSSKGRIWSSKTSYHRFRTEVLPAVQRFDSDLLEKLRRWQDIYDSLDDKEDNQVKKNRNQKKSALKTGLLIANNPHNPYPIFKLFLSAENYSNHDLYQAYECLSKADLRMKSGAENKRLVLEKMIVKICKKK
jgi:DNA polymerase-3 subunit delta